MLQYLLFLQLFQTFDALYLTCVGVKLSFVKRFYAFK